MPQFFEVKDDLNPALGGNFNVGDFILRNTSGDGNVRIGNYVLDADQSLTGLDTYVLALNSGVISLTSLGSVSNPFDQTLNTDDDVEFNTIALGPTYGIAGNSGSLNSIQFYGGDPSSDEGVQGGSAFLSDFVVGSDQNSIIFSMQGYVNIDNMIGVGDFGSTLVRILNGNSLAFTEGSAQVGSSNDPTFVRVEDNTIGVRNGTNPMAFTVDGTYTSTTDFERMRFYATGTTFDIVSESGSGGGTDKAIRIRSAADLQLRAGTGDNIDLWPGNTLSWRMTTAALQPITGADIGTDSLRVGTIFSTEGNFSDDVTIGNYVFDSTQSMQDGYSLVHDNGTGKIILANRLANVIEDTSPQLGGNLDRNGFTIDGRVPSIDGAKLDGIESGATADQTGAEIKTLYEGEADTNAFTDADHSKLDGIESGATADQTGAEIKTAYEAEANTNAFTDSEKAKLASIDATHYLAPVADITALTAITEASLTDKARTYVESETTDYFYDAEAVSGDEAPDDQTGGTGWWKKVIASGESAASIKTKYESNADTNAFTDADHSKLDGIESGATADQTGAEIKTLYEAEADTNAFTDADHSKLDGIESGATADQTGAEIKAAYEGESNTNAFTDAEQSKLSGIESNATADQTGAEIKTLYEAEADTNAFTDADHSKLDGIEASADVTDTANVDAAGAVMETDTDASGWGSVLDEDDFASDSATQLATQQSIKAFVETRPRSITLLVTSGAISAGDGAHYFPVPPELNGYNLSGVYGRVITVSSSGDIDIQVHNVTDAVDMLEALNPLTILQSATADDGTAVVDTANDDVVTDDLLRIDIDSGGTGAEILMVRLEFLHP